MSFALGGRRLFLENRHPRHRRVGAALGSRWAKAGHKVTFGSRQPQSEKVLQVVEKCGASAKAGSPAQAVADAEAILLAVPWSVARQTLAELGDLRGRPVIDCTNPLLPDLSGIELGHSTSAAEQLAAAAPTARIVKAFNSASVKVMNDPQFGEHQAAMFYCGDDAAAKAVVQPAHRRHRLRARRCRPAGQRPLPGAAGDALHPPGLQARLGQQLRVQGDEAVSGISDFRFAISD